MSKMVKIKTWKDWDVVPKLVVKSKYLCEICGREYSTKKEAEKCESLTHICIFNNGCEYPENKNEKCNIHIYKDEYHICKFLKPAINGKPTCIKNFDDGSNYRRGGPICDDCKYRIECKKVSPKREHKDCRSPEEVYRQEIENRKYSARRNYEEYMDSYW